jgi:hypothetical protein
VERFPNASDAMPDAREVLLIDRRAEELLSTAESAGGPEDVHLLTAESLAEGRKLLARYGAVIDAVLVSDRLPEGAREPERMRSVYPRLPVVPFEVGQEAGPEASSPEEQAKAVPPPLGPSAASRALQRALGRARAALNGEAPEAASAGSGPASGHAEPLVLTEDAEGAGCACHFAFQLSNVAEARSEKEAARAASVAGRWHRRLPGVLARYAPGATFRLRYVADPHAEPSGRLRVALVVTVAGDAESQLGCRARRLAGELGTHLAREAQPDSGAGVYHFRPVRSEEALRGLLVPVLPRTAARFSPRALTASLPPAALALAGLGEAGDLPERVQMPAAEAGPEARTSLHALCDLLLRQRSPTVVELALRPRARLSGREQRLLRALAVLFGPGGDRDLVPRGGPTPGEKQRLAGRAETLLSERLFEAGCYVARKGDGPLPQPLQAAVAEGFRGASAQVEPAYAEVRGGLLQLKAATGRGGEEALARALARSEAKRFFRLPLPLEHPVPGLGAAHPTRSFVPEGLASEGPVLGARETNSTAGERQLVRLRPEDLRRHVHILGQTGTGKTTLLLSMLRERMESGAGVGLIDPHGDFWERALGAVPKSRRGDVVLFDPADPESDARLNLLEYDPAHPQQKSMLIEELFEIFREDNRPDWVGPMFQMYMRNACLLAMESAEAFGTLLDVVNVFQDEDFRERLLRGGVSEPVRTFWSEEAASAGRDLDIDNITPYITSKLGTFVYNDTLRRLIGAPKSTIDFRKVLDGGKILLAKLPKGRLGAFGTRLTGRVLVARLLMAALSRENVPEGERRDFTLFMDEFQTFTSAHTASMLSEARKYRLGLVMANQALGQLRGKIRSALGNAASRIFFRPVPEDYPHVAPYLSPPFERREVTQLPNFTAAARLMIEGEPADPFLFETLPPCGDTASE